MARQLAQLGRLHSWAKAERRPDREEVWRALADDGIACAWREWRLVIGAGRLPSACPPAAVIPGGADTAAA